MIIFAISSLESAMSALVGWITAAFHYEWIVARSCELDGRAIWVISCSSARARLSNIFVLMMDSRRTTVGQIGNSYCSGLDLFFLAMSLILVSALIFLDAGSTNL